ncbi:MULTISPECIES: anti-sigma factor domain-containing protein [Bhargavaea]|uniref:RsgI N-terminal anti-sigma domain-containing protein n=1 Tax=Bhargavaea changchunensis TaxID=2134037 RepID=A0ABW2N8K6_9BACL|nr:hypothetical protein [Bhargavaea sp. CC-171006]
MNQIKGIVVEQNNQSVVILTPDGRFIRGESQGQEIGSESLVTPMEPKSRPRLSTAPKPVAVAGMLAAAILVLLSALFLPLREPALAFIQVEVNPAVEFGIDGEGKVRELTPLNNDGTALIRMFGDWDGKDVTMLLGRIFEEYGEADRELTVTSVETADGNLAGIIERTEGFIRDAAGEEGMHLRLSEADRELRDQAMKEGVPISRLINPDSQSGEPSPAGQEHKENAEREKPAPASPEGVPTSENSSRTPAVKKNETSPPESGTREKPDDGPKKNSLGQDNDGDPPAHAGPDKKSPPPGHAGQKNQSGPPSHAGPDKKSSPPGQAGQKNQSKPPSHAGPDKSPPGQAGQNKQSGPQPKVKSGEKPGGDRVSPRQNQNSHGNGNSSETGQRHKNSGNGKGGDGNSSGK